MKKYDVVVIGASAAGITAGITAKRHYPGKSVLVIRKEQLVSIPCGIPYIFGVVGTPDKNLIPVDDILPKNEIDALVGNVVRIDRDQRTVATCSGEQIEYQRLIIATGSDPVVPPIQGIDKKNIYVIKKDIPYLREVVASVEKADSICIVGCGFIGVEIAEECKRKRPDVNVHIVEMMRHCLQLVYDNDFCVKAEDALRSQGISLLLDKKVESFNGERVVEKMKIVGGGEIDAHVVILGIGARANSSIASDAGLEIGHTRAIQVNRYMQTSDRNIFACGDCAEKVSFFDGKPSNLKLASIATMEARIAGANLFVTTRVNMGVIGVYSTVIGGSAFAAAGLTKSQAEEKGYGVVEGIAESVNRHPCCMPGASALKVKLLFEAGSQIIIGGQITGAKSGGELINTISACIHQRMTADDISTFQTGTHPALTASPIAYQLVNAAEIAIKEMKMRLTH